MANLGDLVLMGRKVYVAHADSPVLVGMLKESVTKNRWTHVGFDVEYTASGIGPGSSQSVSLIQLATPEAVFLFHVHGQSSLSSLLSSVLTSRDVVKVGFDATNDSKLMYDTFGVSVSGILDLQPLVYILGCPGRGLADAAMHYSSIQLDKGATSRDWRTLSVQKVTYAAMDAIACLEIMKSLTPFLSTERRIPASSLLPKPAFPSTVQAASAAEVKALERWFRTVQVAPTHEKRVNQIVNSYAPWIKHTLPERETLARAALQQIRPETFLLPPGGTPYTTAPGWYPPFPDSDPPPPAVSTSPPDSTPSPTVPQTVPPTPPPPPTRLPGRDTAAERDEGRVYSFLRTVLLADTRPRDKVLSQVVNSVGPLEGVSIHAPAADRRRYIDGVLERLAARRLIVLPTPYEICFPK
jgi:hypothetical protein